MSNDSESTRALSCTAVLVAGAALLVSVLVLFRPDRPVADLVPGASAGPAFVVQIVRPRMGLPLGGALPPGWFGQDAELGFDSRSDGARVVRVEPRRVELGADGWELVLVVDDEGRVTDETSVVFELLFQERLRTVRCRPGVPVAGTLVTTALDGGELAGRFELELPRCEDAETGESLGWPPRPFVLRGSFDRLPLD